MLDDFYIDVQNKKPFYFIWCSKYLTVIVFSFLGLNDEAYLKRLGIKECKIKGPGFSEGNHGGAISDEWAQKLGLLILR